MNAGDRIAGRFVVESLLGAGGMGTVYQARDEQTGETVAVKLLRAGRESSRFLQEAELLASLRHPAVVRYVAHGPEQDGFFLAMELLKGVDLAARIRQGPLSTKDAILLTRRAAEGLGAAHARGIVHRDVKPSNIFLPDEDPRLAKVLDFGVARVGRASTERKAVGTPGYMAPEQARGERSVDARADVFALGCVLFECLTGRAAFVGEHAMALLAKILLEEAPRVSELLPDVPAPLDDLVARMLSKDPRARPADGGEVKGALDEIDTDASAPRAAASSLGRSEQRLVSVLLLRAERPVALPTDENVRLPRAAQLEVDAVSEVVEPLGGRVERLLDGTIAVLLSSARGALDQAATAARAALSLTSAVETRGRPLALATGRALVGQRWAVGDAIDRASALLATKLERPGPRIDPLTASLLGGRFEVGADEHGLWLASETRDAGTRTLLGRALPCVGRERELDLLSSLVEEATSEGVARAALITASPGLGKTRLVTELVSRLRRDDAPIVVLEGWGDPTGLGAGSFALLAHAIRGAAGVSDGEPLAVRHEKIRALTELHVRTDGLRVAEFLGELLGATFPATGRVELAAARADAMLLADQTKRALTDLFAGAAARATVVLVADDLHWADAPSLGLLDTLLAELSDAPLVVLGLARPELSERFSDLWSGRAVTRIQLAPLTKKGSEALVRGALGKVDDATIARLLERASGNALFLEELVRAVAEGRADALPETVLAIVEARLSRLDLEARRALRAASVFGAVFWRGAVSALLDMDATRVDEAIDLLEGKELVQRRNQTRFEGERELAFRHALVRDAAHATLTEEDRALGHRLAGEWLERAGEKDAAIVADHYLAGSAPTRAAPHLVRAAEQALGGNDLDAAIARAAEAGRAGATGATLGAARLVEAQAFTWRGEHATAEARGREALTLLARASGPWCEAAGEVAIASGRLGHVDVLVDVGEELAAIRSTPEAARERTVARARAAMQALVTGRYDLADALLARLDEDAPLVDADPIAVARLSQARGFRAHFSGDLGAYLEQLERAAASFERAGDRRNACVQRGNVGHALIALGAYGEAVASLRSALRLAGAMKLEHIASVAKHNLGLALAHEASGDRAMLEEAHAMETAALADFTAQEDQRLIGASRAYLAEIAIERGELDEARQQARLAAELGASSPPLVALALATLSRAELAAGDVKAALASSERAMALLEELGTIDEGEALVRLQRAEALLANGDGDGDAEAARAILIIAKARVLEAADRVRSPERRDVFLTRVRENARIVALATSL